MHNHCIAHILYVENHYGCKGHCREPVHNTSIKAFDVENGIWQYLYFERPLWHCEYEQLLSCGARDFPGHSYTNYLAIGQNHEQNWSPTSTA